MRGNKKEKKLNEWKWTSIACSALLSQTSNESWKVTRSSRATRAGRLVFIIIFAAQVLRLHRIHISQFPMFNSIMIQFHCSMARDNSLSHRAVRRLSECVTLLPMLIPQRVIKIEFNGNFFEERGRVTMKMKRWRWEDRIFHWSTVECLFYELQLL